MAGTSVGEFFLSLVVDAGKGELTINGLVASMGELEVASVGEIAILAELAEKLATLTATAIKTSLGIEDVTTRTGMSSKALQDWKNVAEFVGVSGETMAQTLASISKNLQAGISGGNYGGLRDLGVLLQHAHISLQQFKADKPEELIKAIRKSDWFQGLTPAQQNWALGSSGLDAILPVLQKRRLSDADIKKYMAEGPVISDDQIRKYDQINRALIEIHHLTQTIGNRIANWFSEGFLKGLRLVAETLNIVANQVDRVGKAKTSVSAGSSDLLGKLIEHIPLGEQFNKLRYAYGAAGAAFLGVPNAENPFSAVSPATSYLQQASSGKQTVVNYHPTVKVEGSRLNKMEMMDAIKLAFEGTFQPLTAQLNVNPT